LGRAELRVVDEVADDRDQRLVHCRCPLGSVWSASGPSGPPGRRCRQPPAPPTLPYAPRPGRGSCADLWTAGPPVDNLPTRTRPAEMRRARTDVSESTGVCSSARGAPRSGARARGGNIVTDATFGYRLGKQPPKHDPRTFQLASYLTDELPAAPR